MYAHSYMPLLFRAGHMIKLTIIVKHINTAWLRKERHSSVFCGNRHIVDPWVLKNLVVLCKYRLTDLDVLIFLSEDQINWAHSALKKYYKSQNRWSKVENILNTILTLCTAEVKSNDHIPCQCATRQHDADWSWLTLSHIEYLISKFHRHTFLKWRNVNR